MLFFFTLVLIPFWSSAGYVPGGFHVQTKSLYFPATLLSAQFSSSGAGRSMHRSTFNLWATFDNVQVIKICSQQTHSLLTLLLLWVPFPKQVCSIKVTALSFTAAALQQYRDPEHCCRVLGIPHRPQSRGLAAFQTVHVLFKLLHWEENYVFCNASGQWAKGTIEYELGVRAGALQCSALCVF